MELEEPGGDYLNLAYRLKAGDNSWLPPKPGLFAIFKLMSTENDVGRTRDGLGGQGQWSTLMVSAKSEPFVHNDEFTV